MNERQTAKTTVAVRPVLRSCAECIISEKTRRVTGCCSYCASMVESMNGERALWVYVKPILDGAAVIHALPAELQKPPRLLLVE